MFTDLIVKFLMWMEKHDDLVMKAIIFGLSFSVGLLLLKVIMVFPEFIKELIWR